MGFPTSHHQYVGTPANNAAILAEADVAFAIGYEFTEKGVPDEKRMLPSGTRLVTLSVDPMLTAKQLWPDVALHGHPKPSLARLVEILKHTPVAEDARARNREICAAPRQARQTAIEEADALPGDQSPVPQKKLIREVYKQCGSDWIIVQAGSTLGWHVETMYDFDDPLNFHAVSGKGSAQGWGAPTAIGMQMGAEDRRVLAFLGDGNLMFSATCMWSAAQQNLPVVFVVNNNQGWLCVPDAIDAVYDMSTGLQERNEMAWTWESAPVDFTQFAQSLGLEAKRVTTADDLSACLKTAKASNRPWLIEVVGE